MISTEKPNTAPNHSERNSFKTKNERFPSVQKYRRKKWNNKIIIHSKHLKNDKYTVQSKTLNTVLHNIDEFGGIRKSHKGYISLTDSSNWKGPNESTLKRIEQEKKSILYDYKRKKIHLSKEEVDRFEGYLSSYHYAKQKEKVKNVFEVMTRVDKKLQSYEEFESIGEEKEYTRPMKKGFDYISQLEDNNYKKQHILSRLLRKNRRTIVDFDFYNLDELRNSLSSFHDALINLRADWNIKFSQVRNLGDGLNRAGQKNLNIIKKLIDVEFPKILNVSKTLKEKILIENQNKEKIIALLDEKSELIRKSKLQKEDLYFLNARFERAKEGYNKSKEYIVRLQRKINKIRQERNSLRGNKKELLNQIRSMGDNFLENKSKDIALKDCNKKVKELEQENRVLKKRIEELLTSLKSKKTEMRILRKNNNTQSKKLKNMMDNEKNGEIEETNKENEGDDYSENDKKGKIKNKLTSSGSFVQSVTIRVKEKGKKENIIEEKKKFEENVDMENEKNDFLNEQKKIDTNIFEKKNKNKKERVIPGITKGWQGKVITGITQSARHNKKEPKIVVTEEFLLPVLTKKGMKLEERYHSSRRWESEEEREEKSDFSISENIKMESEPFEEKKKKNFFQLHKKKHSNLNVVGENWRTFSGDRLPSDKEEEKKKNEDDTPLMSKEGIIQEIRLKKRSMKKTLYSVLDDREILMKMIFKTHQRVRNFYKLVSRLIKSYSGRDGTKYSTSSFFKDWVNVNKKIDKKRSINRMSNREYIRNKIERSILLEYQEELLKRSHVKLNDSVSGLLSMIFRKMTRLLYVHSFSTKKLKKRQIMELRRFHSPERVKRRYIFPKRRRSKSANIIRRNRFMTREERMREKIEKLKAKFNS